MSTGDPIAVPKAGEVWHVKVKGGNNLATMKVTEVTEHTVAFESLHPPRFTLRYKFEDIELVEKVK